jgi:hypothetical protein
MHAVSIFMQIQNGRPCEFPLHAHKTWMIFSFSLHTCKKYDDMIQVEHKFLYKSYKYIHHVAYLIKNLISVQLTAPQELGTILWQT